MLTQHKSVNYLHSKYNVQDERGPKSLDGLNYCMSQSNLQQEFIIWKLENLITSIKCDQHIPAAILCKLPAELLIVSGLTLTRSISKIVREE